MNLGCCCSAELFIIVCVHVKWVVVLWKKIKVEVEDAVDDERGPLHHLLRHHLLLYPRLLLTRLRCSP